MRVQGLQARQAAGWRGRYFGGVAFKYQRPVEDVATAARAARHYVDVVTTSGDGTGMRASVRKVHAMKEALGDFPLAVASGITPANVTDYLPWADAFLVATGISRGDWANLDPGLTRQLVDVVRACDCANGGTG